MAIKVPDIGLLVSRVAVLAMLAATMLLVTSAAGAGPRDPTPQWKNPYGPPTEMEVWLRRLVGRFRVDGMIQAFHQPDPEKFALVLVGQESIQGMGDCVSVGTGPGVQCVMNMAWEDIFQIVLPPEAPAGFFNVPGGVSFLNPAMALFGIDPGEAGIHYLLVDNKGLPEGGVGFNSGSRVTFKTSCVNAPKLLAAMIPDKPYRTCDRVIRIDARPEARVMNLAMDIAINDIVLTRVELTLRRDPGVGAAPANRR
jgi:hypothetical protein